MCEPSHCAKGPCEVGTFQCLSEVNLLLLIVWATVTNHQGSVKNCSLRKSLKCSPRPLGLRLSGQLLSHCLSFLHVVVGKRTLYSSLTTHPSPGKAKGTKLWAPLPKVAAWQSKIQNNNLTPTPYPMLFNTHSVAGDDLQTVLLLYWLAPDLLPEYWNNPKPRLLKIGSVKFNKPFPPWVNIRNLKLFWNEMTESSVMVL